MPRTRQWGYRWPRRIRRPLLPWREKNTAFHGGGECQEPGSGVIGGREESGDRSCRGGEEHGVPVEVNAKNQAVGLSVAEKNHAVAGKTLTRPWRRWTAGCRRLCESLRQSLKWLRPCTTICMRLPGRAIRSTALEDVKHERNHHHQPGQPRPSCATEIVNGIVKYQHFIEPVATSDLAMCHFMAQLAHESAGFQTTREFASGKAYEGRKDLGNVQPGDGQRYRGRGLIQTTGRANYREARDDIRKIVPDAPDFEQQPQDLEKFPWALLSAVSYWTRRKIGELCRSGRHSRRHARSERRDKRAG